MTDTLAAYHFVSWLHRGAAAKLTQADNHTTPDAPVRATVDVSISFNTGAKTATAHLGLFGPADITAVDPAAIARVWPPPGTLDAESNYFPVLEFAQPDFPWRYTPRAADSDGRLRPWCALIVLTDAEIQTNANGVLVINPSVPLPPPDQTWAWAHVQISGDYSSIDGIDLPTVVATSPERCLARLLCPRRLHASTQYTAFLVPAFDVGRLAGLRQSVGNLTTTQLKPAWAGTTSSAGLTLPVYYQWRFGTGPGGDFESLVRKLVPAALPATAGLRDLDVSAPGGELANAAYAPATTLSLGSALVSPDAPTPSIDDINGSFTDELSDLISTAPDAIIASGGETVVTPPLYGTWHAQQARTFVGSEPPWFSDLNMDPRLRVPAAVGAAVVQAQQDALMASAWQQVDGIREANAQLQAAQLAREVSRRLHARFLKSGTNDRQLQLSALVHSHVKATTVTAGKLVRNSPPRAALLSGPFCRLRRARGPLGRRQLRPDTTEGLVVSNVNSGTYNAVLVATPAPGAKLLTHTWVHTQQTSWNWRITPTQITSAAQQPKQIAWDSIYGTKPTSPLGSATDSSSMALFRTAALNFANRALTYDSGSTLHKLAVATLSSTVTGALDPVTTIPAAFQSRFQGVLTYAWNPPDPIQPVMAYPVFPQPMFSALAAQSQDWLMAGLSDVGANTATLAVTNDAFIEAFLVGLNHEMARELLWNDYPTDQRGSYFRQFWDAAGFVLPPTPETSKDITPLNTWPSTSQLGSHSPRTAPTSGGKFLVLVVRSEVLRRYPNTVVYAAKAIYASGAYTVDEAQQQMPVFGGRLDPDLAFFGFDLTKATAHGSGTTADPGWFFVFQEQPHTPRFGLDVGTPAQAGTTPASWDDLAWPHLVAAGHDPDELAYIDLAATLPTTGGLEVANGWAWHLTPAGAGKPVARGADHAAITQQRPVRVAMHGSLLLLP